MTDVNNLILSQVRIAAAKRLLFLPHTIRQMTRPYPMLTSGEVANVIETGEVIEDYPEDRRGHSCLIFARGLNERPVHVLCSPKDDYLAVITAYVPDPQKWTTDYRVRR